ncbi:class I adenylate-forming enzyme family protein [Desulfoscipio gibsoniae]|uniref:Acyl-CoA synthetase (AMP-forming)/AMP-acid ligase II n=1 Tax=Desulfoscipio gibsoniae DSM 7213 TaxID=767817 RepID=R4KFT3_9FIRM|nr:long-chain-fatty-acid--CoA ligase [Desulfoscipio gibsoniae]AGL02043.1 acyl-CoA synthetase (AMP-forming)/AMP-acid ligase II [Desulfoscipio gibsoniae DSM 7213]
MNVSDLITNNASFNPNYKAIICGDDGREYTWSEFDKIINQLGNALVEIGVNKGDRVAIYLPNSPEFLFTYFAVAKIGAVATPFNILFKTAEITYILNNSRAKVLVGSGDEIDQNLIKVNAQTPHLEKIITVGKPVEGAVDFYSIILECPEDFETVDCSSDDLATLMYTSGTTGQPKGAMLSHGNFISIAAVNSKMVQINDQDLYMTATPYCHIFFVQSVLGPFHAGAGVVTMRSFNAEKTLELLSRYQVTHFAGVPTMYIFMLDQFDSNKYDLSAWRLAVSAAASMPVEHINKIKATFGVEFSETYGATETSSTVTYGRVGHGRVGSVGPVGRGNRAKVVDNSGSELPAGEVGEILVKTPGVFKGYWEMPEATREAFDEGWYHTGDLGKFDEDGYLYIVDRKKDMIVCGGYNVYPREVEEVIYQHPKVMEAAVLGVKDPVRGEVPKAFIRLKDNEEMTDQELIDFCKQMIANYKVPRNIEFMEELPKGPTGKILKRKLKETI